MHVDLLLVASCIELEISYYDQQFCIFVEL